jgi:hypothetical protein
MSLADGTPLGSYRVTALLGAGRTTRTSAATSPRSSSFAAAVLAIAALAAVVALVVKRRSPTPDADGKKRIAVLPFENLGSPDQDYFADGVADEVRGKLTSLPSLAVIARGSLN